MGAGSSHNGATLLVYQLGATNRSTAARKRQPTEEELPVSWEFELPGGTGSSQIRVGAPKMPKECFGAPRGNWEQN